MVDRKYLKYYKKLYLKQALYKSLDQDKLSHLETKMYDGNDLTLAEKVKQEFNYDKNLFLGYQGDNLEDLKEILNEIQKLFDSQTPDYNKICELLLVACEICGIKSALFKEIVDLDLSDVNILNKEDEVYGRQK